MAEKEATVFIVDVGKSMKNISNGRDVSDLDWSLQYVFDKITSIVATARKTLFVGVIGLGTDETENDMASDDSYQHISVIQPLLPMAMPQLRTLSARLKPSSTNRRDAMSAIILAIDMIMKHCRHLQFKKKICLVTNASGAMDPDDIDSTVEQIKRNNIELTVLGVDFDDSAYGVKEEDKSHTKAVNEELLRKLVDDCGGLFGTMQEAIEGLAIPHLKHIRPTPTFKGQLRLGDPSTSSTAITIDIERYFKVSIRRPPTASSFVLKQNQAEPDDGLEAVQSSRKYVVFDETQPNNEKAIDREELAKGYQYGRTAVPISESDENITKLETATSYDILGFIPKENVERYMILENTNMLVAQKGNDKATLALSSFVHSLFEIDSCAIGRVVKKDMSEPTLTLLTPLANDEIECLIEDVLPFAEDLRQYRFPPVDRVITVSGKHLQSHRNLPDDSLLEAMSEFVDDMTMDDNDALQIESMYSPVVHRIEGAIKHRAIYPEAELPELKQISLAPSEQPRDLKDRSKVSLRQLITAADVKKVPPKVKGRRKYRETEKPLSGLNVADLFRKEKRTTVSSDNAIPEFKQLIDTADDIATVHDAARQFHTIIEDQIRSSLGDKQYDRVIEELGVIRSELDELEEAEIWNDIIRDLKKKISSGQLGGNRAELWWRIRLAKLGLVNSTDAETNSFLVL